MYNHNDKRIGQSIDCPFCGYKQSGGDWLRTIRDVNYQEKSLSDDNRIGVSSKCPCCERLSWAHYDRNIIEIIRYNKKAMEEYITYYNETIPYI